MLFRSVEWAAPVVVCVVWFMLVAFGVLLLCVFCVFVVYYSCVSYVSGSVYVLL